MPIGSRQFHYLEVSKGQSVTFNYFANILQRVPAMATLSGLLMTRLVVTTRELTYLAYICKQWLIFFQLQCYEPHIHRHLTCIQDWPPMGMVSM